MTKEQRLIYKWLWLGIGMIILMVIIGGITRLTGSGLSMTNWNLIMGAIPPLNEQDWIAAFQEYKQFPQFQLLNFNLTLPEFKQIFFWEYLHRMLGRLLGLVFIIPFLFFWMRGYFDQKLKKKMLFLLALGALQGAMGWFMVKSGLVDMPYVSHYRLAIHLLLAMTLIGVCYWFTLDLRRNDNTSAIPSNFKTWSLVIGFFFLVQVIWGAFTAGLHAGFIYNTFPLMNGSWLPHEMWRMKPAILNFIANHGVVQWFHRVNGTLLFVLVISFWLKTRTASDFGKVQKNALLLLGFIAFQYLLGIITLLNFVPVSLGVAHQFTAIVAGMIWLKGYHHLTKNALA